MFIPNENCNNTCYVSRQGCLHKQDGDKLYLGNIYVTCSDNLILRNYIQSEY